MSCRPQSFQRRLLAHSLPSGSAPERRLVSLSALADSLGVSEAVAGALVDVVEAASPVLPAPDAATGCDMHSLLMLLFVNTYARPHVQSSLRNAGDAWPEGGKGGAGVGGVGVHAPVAASQPGKHAGPASPTKARRAVHSSAEDEALQHAFVLRHLATLLPLLRSTPAAGAAGCVPTAQWRRSCVSHACCPPFARRADVQLSAHEFDRIGFLFAVAGQPACTRLSDVAPAFAGGVQKSISLPAARDWLCSSCGAPGHQAGGRPGPGGDCSVEGAVRTTVLLREADVACGGTLRVSNCSDCVLYLLAPCATASLVACTDCTVVLGCVARALRMEQCERCVVHAPARHVQLRSCHAGQLHLATPRPLLALGDTRGVKTAPYGCFYDALGLHLAAGGLSPLAPNRWDQFVTLQPQQPLAGAQPQQQQQKGAALSPLLPEEHSPFVIPFSVLPAGAPQPTAACPFAQPPAYAAALQKKAARVAEVQAEVRDAQLEEPVRRELQAAIQAHFREWLLLSGNMRPVCDLSRIG